MTDGLSRRVVRISPAGKDTWEIAPEGELIPGLSPPSEGAERQPFYLLPGKPHPALENIEPQLIEIIQRVAPWSTFYLAPGFSNPTGAGGLAWEEMEVAVLECSAEHSTTYQINACYHECWHIAEEQLRHNLLAEVTRECGRGPIYANEYLNLPKERRARAFAAFAVAAHEGITVAGTGAAATFARVYNGDLAREVMASRKPRPSASVPFWRRLAGRLTRAGA